MPGLSSHFLVWDLDMVPLRQLRLLWPPPPGANTGRSQYQVAFPLSLLEGSTPLPYIAQLWVIPRMDVQHKGGSAHVICLVLSCTPAAA